MKKKWFAGWVIGVLVGCLWSVALGETMVVDDHFDDENIETNTYGVGTGFNWGTWSGGAVIVETGTTVTLENSEVAWARVSITSKEGANFSSGICRFEFRGVQFSQSPNGWDWGGSTSRLTIGVKNANTANNYDDGLWPGFYITFESDDMFTGQNTQWNGVSTLFYRSLSGVNTQLASWSFNTLNWDDWANFAATSNFTPVLNLTLDISATDYSLKIEGDTITLLSGALEGSFASLGITNELTTGYAFAYSQTENPSLFTTIDQIVIKEGLTPWGPYDPAVLPENPEGSVGVLISNEEAEVTLTWKAGKDPDPERGYPVNPDILGHFILLSTGASSDPNVYLYDYVPQVHAEDPYETDPNNTYGPIVLSEGTVYYWQIVEQIKNPATGQGYPLGDPNNLPGSVWRFTTIGVAPQILTQPESTYIDAEGDASFSVTASVSATHYRWFKVSEPEPIALTDEGPYSGTQTATLQITGGTLAEEGQYYCIAYNGDPDMGGTPSAPSQAAWLWIPRLLIHYPLDTIEEEGGIQTTPDVAGGFDMQLMNIAPEGDLPSLTAGVPELGDSGLFFNNSDRQDPNHAWGQYATAGPVMMEELGNSLTISFWVKWIGNNGDWQGIINRRGSWSASDMMWRIDKNPTTGEISFERADGSGRVATTLVEGEWHFITLTYDSTTLTTRMYNNGELMATGTGFTYGTGVNSGFKLGCNNDIGSEFFYGVLDDVRIFNYARTTEEIARDYLAVRGGWVCNYELYDLPYDFNRDCLVNLEDLALFAATWLDSYRIYAD